MKNKYTVITICAALAIVVAGYFSLSLMTNGFFRAGADIYEETDNSDAMQTAANELILHCAYPLMVAESSEETDVTEREKKYYLGEIDATGVFLDVASTINQNIFSDKVYQQDAILADDQFLVMDATVDSGDYIITTAYYYGELLGYCCLPTAEPSEEQIKTAVEDLKIIIEKNDQKLAPYLKTIENLNENNTASESSFSYVGTQMLYLMMEQANDKSLLSDTEDSFYEEYHSIYDCYKYGSKKILTNGKEVILLSSVGDCGVAVFYDAINSRFSGINLLFISN